MAPAVLEREPQTLEGSDRDLAAEAVQALVEYLKRNGDRAGQLVLEPADLAPGEEAFRLPVPVPVFKMLREILAQLALGNGVSIVPYHSELTTQQAAELLNVSRPYVVKLLDQGKLPYRRVGPRRRIKLSDLLDFKHEDDAKRTDAARELTAEAERIGLKY